MSQCLKMDIPQQLDEERSSDKEVAENESSQAGELDASVETSPEEDIVEISVVDDEKESVSNESLKDINDTDSPGLVTRAIRSGRRPFDVALKGGRPWGFALDGGAGSPSPLYISKIVSGSKAYESALLEGDILLRVNDTPCTDVGQALDLVDTCVDILSLTVLRGPQPAQSSEPVRAQSYLQRVLGEYRKQETGPGNLRHSFNDDNAIYRTTRLAGMKPHKPRGESFSIGQQQRESYQKRNQPSSNARPSSYHHVSHPSSSTTITNNSSDHRRSLPAGQSLLHTEPEKTGSVVSQTTDSSPAAVAEMNRRRSEGNGLSTGARSWTQQQQQLMSQRHDSQPGQSQAQPQQRQSQPLSSQPYQQLPLMSMKSSPNLASSEGFNPGHLSHDKNPKLTLQTQPYHQYNPTDISATNLRQQTSPYSQSLTSYPSPTQGSPGIYSSAFNDNHGRSIPSHNLQRYQPDYENMSHFGTAPLGSEKISEIDDIEEVTSKDLSPVKPDVKLETGLEGMPTRDINTLKYLKVNQSHEKYPSWPVSRPNEPTDQSQSINSRAQSMTDHTDTSSEFPKKQRMAYTPGLRPLPEKISPSQERKGDEGKLRNTSDPGFKSEFVQDKYGRVQRRNFDNVEQNFEDFYQNSKSGYPPPSMDPDGHNIGDKDYNAPSPPERDNGKAAKSADGDRIQEKLTRPSDLNISSSAARVDSGTSPLESSNIPLNYSTNKSYQSPNQWPTSTNNPNPSAVPQASPMSPSTRDNPFTTTNNRALSFKDPSSNKSSPHSNISRNRPMSQGSASSSNSAGGAGSGGGAYIVKQTPYYNTSTQTEMMPYSIKITNPSSYANTPVGNFATQTSPVSPDDQRKWFDEKSGQARLSKDFQTSGDNRNLHISDSSYRYTSGQSPYLDYEGIHAKYSTDDTPTYDQEPMTAHQKYQNFGDNTATMLRKLSEEFYKGRYGSSSSDKRNVSSSSSGHESSPRYDSSVFQQPGMREAESYSSVVIHPDVSGGLFGRDDADSKHNVSMSESSGYKSMDLGTPMSRFSLDSSVMNLKMNQELQKPAGSVPFSKHFRESSVPVGSRYQMRSDLSSSNSDLIISETSSPIYAAAGGSSAMPKSSMSDSYGVASTSERDSSKALHIVEDKYPSIESNRLSTDSVFLEDVNKMDEGELPAFEFIRKPSMRKAYGIYDETESLISQTKGLNKPQGQGCVTGLRDGIPSSNPKAASMPRGIKPSESSSLGLIQEEGDSTNQEDLKNITKPLSEFPMMEKLTEGRKDQNVSDVLKRSQQQPQYAWQNESWRKDRPEFDAIKRSNLKRTASEQIAALPKQGSAKPSLDPDLSMFNRPSDFNKENQTSTSLTSHQASSRMSPSEQPRSSGSGSPTEPELKKVQQQAVLNFFQRKTTGSVSDILHIDEGQKDTSAMPPLKSPLTENTWTQNPSASVSGTSTSSTESVSDIISKANENLAKSAQRVDSIRRSSSSFRHSADYMDMTKPDRMRKETEWSKLRSSGSLRYSPDNSFRSNRSSFASENHYEDINLFAASPGDSADTGYHERERSDPSMDSGFAGSNSYQNYQAKRRPPPAVPSPSGDGPPPALPPRNYNKTVYVNSDNLILSANSSSKALHPSSPKTVTPPPSSLPSFSHNTSTPSSKDPRGSSEEFGIDQTKKDFKSLMTQWENSSPREEGYAAKLRKEAQRYTNPSGSHLQPHPNQALHNPQTLGQFGGAQAYHPQQHQQQQNQHLQHAPSSKSTPPNATPMALMHSRTAINFSTTYKRQPTVPQEATLPSSPTSSHPQQPSFPASINTVAPPSVLPSSSTVSPFSSSSSSIHMSSPHQMSSNSYTIPPKQSQQTSSASHSISTITNNANNRQSIASSIGGSSSASHHSPAASNISFSSSHSSNSMDTTPPPRPPERAGITPPSSSSSSHPDQKTMAVSTAGIHLNRGSPSSRDINTDNNSGTEGPKQSNSYRSPQAPQHSQSSPSKSSQSPNEQQTKWKPKRGPVIPSPPLPPDPSSVGNSTNPTTTNTTPNTTSTGSSNLQGGNNLTVGGDTDFPPPPPELTQQSLDYTENEVFSEESYIGHKNKTSRPIGSYKRSKSAAALPSTEKSTNANGVAEQDGAGSGTFPDRTPLKPSWKSDWTLQSREDPTLSPPPPASSVKEDLTRARTSRFVSSSPSSTHNQQQPPQTQAPADLSFTSSDTPPVRPARPSASSRKELSDPLASSSSPSSSLSSTSSATNPQYKSSVNNSSPPSSLPYHHHQVPPDSSTAAGTPVFTAKPFVIAQPHTQRMGPVENTANNTNSPRRAPPPVPNSPPFDPTHDLSPLAKTTQGGSNPSYHHQHQSPSSLSSSSSPFISPSSSSSLPMSSSSLLPSSFSSTASPPHRPWQSPESTPPSSSSKPSYNSSNTNSYPTSSHASNFNNSTSSIPTSNNLNNTINNSNLRITEDQPPSLPPPREHQSQQYPHRRESEPMKPTPYSAPSFDSLRTASDNLQPPALLRHKSESSGLNTGDNSLQTAGGHTRQPSQEELECDLKAKQLAEELADKDVKLSEVLSSDTNKKRMRYMDGLFSELNGQENNAGTTRLSGSSRSVGSVDEGGSQKDEYGSPNQNEGDGKRTSLPKEYWLSAPKAQIEMTLRHSQEAGTDLTRDIKDGHSLVQQKEELLKKLRKKLEVLGDDKIQLTQEIDDNNGLGKQVDSMLASKFKANPGVVEKYKAYIEDQDKIVRLLLNLSGQLARAENAVEAIPINADSRIKKLTTDKRERLHAKHEEAKVLKADIDKRKDQLSVTIQEGLTEGDWQRYIQFINKRPQLTIELQELEDKLKLGLEQIEELKKSIPSSP